MNNLTFTVSAPEEVKRQSLGYPLIYLDEKDKVYCAKCAANLLKEGEKQSFEAAIFWEGETVDCDECEEWIESAYGPCLSNKGTHV